MLYSPGSVWFWDFHSISLDPILWTGLWKWGGKGGTGWDRGGGHPEEASSVRRLLLPRWHVHEHPCPGPGWGAALCLSVTPLALGEGQAPSLCWLHVAAGRPAALCWGLSSSRCLTPCATWSHPLLLPSEILPVQAEPPSQAQKQIVCVRVCLCVHTEIEIILDDM